MKPISLIKKNQIYTPLLNYVASIYVETEDNNFSVPLNNIKDNLKPEDYFNVEYALVFTFFRNTDPNTDYRKNIAKKWNKLFECNLNLDGCNNIFDRTRECIGALGNDELLKSWIEFISAIPKRVLDEIIVNNFTQNMDGTYCYYLPQLDVMSSHILITSMFSHFSNNKRNILEYIGDDCRGSDMNLIHKMSTNFLKDGLAKGYKNLNEFIIFVNKTLDTTHIFEKFVTSVPKEFTISRPAQYKAQYKNLYESKSK